MKTASVLLLSILLTTAQSQTWRHIGPDSASWRSVRQMDVRVVQNEPRIGVGTARGVAIHMGGVWRYVLPDRFLRPVANDEFYRSIYFSPWNDSTAFIGADVIEQVFGEPGSGGGTVFNIHAPSWLPGINGGGWVGHAPSLSFAFSPHLSGKAYSWIINFSKTTSGGQVWEILSHPSYGSFFLQPDRRRDSVLYAGIRLLGIPGIYRSTDDGRSWVSLRTMSFPYAPPHPYVDFLASGDTLILSTSWFPFPSDSTCGILLSSNQGVSWSRVLDHVNVQKMIRDPLNPTRLFAAAEGKILTSTTAGLMWQALIASLPSSRAVDIRKHPTADTLYIAFADSGVYKVYDYVTHVEPPNAVPLEYTLDQNFPNPFNPFTTITFRLPRDAHVTLTVIDILGREVAVPVREQRTAGVHQVVVDGRSLASGVYFYRMSALGENSSRTDGQAADFVASRRMIVLK